MKKYYTATATMKDSTHEWEVIIYSLYESLEDALHGADRFQSRYKGDLIVKKIKIEENNS